jgi:hypothetical protein
MSEIEKQKNLPEVPSHMRLSSSKNVNFYKKYDIHSYKKPEFKTKIIQNSAQIEKYDYFFN